MPHESHTKQTGSVSPCAALPLFMCNYLLIVLVPYGTFCLDIFFTLWLCDNKALLNLELQQQGSLLFLIYLSHILFIIYTFCVLIFFLNINCIQYAIAAYMHLWLLCAEKCLDKGTSTSKYL